MRCALEVEQASSSEVGVTSALENRRSWKTVPMLKARLNHGIAFAAKLLSPSGLSVMGGAMNALQALSIVAGDS